MRRLGVVALALVAAALALGAVSACGSDDARPRELREVLAPIDELELLIRESAPPQYALRIVSGLPNGCHQFGGYRVTRDGAAIAIAVFNLLPADPDLRCTQLYGQHEGIVELGVDFQSGRRYTVRVNDLTERFRGQ